VRRLPGMRLTSNSLPGVEVWRGGVNRWECDENDHLNVRFFVTRAAEGLMGVAAELGLPHAFTPRAGATLMVREHHIRFLKEARDNAPLHMLGGVLSIGETDAVVLQLLVHSLTGEVAASFRTRVEHVTATEARPFPWSSLTRARTEALKITAPPEGLPRGLPGDGAAAIASLARADAAGMVRIGLGGLTPADCDAFGRASQALVIGRVADGVSRFIDPIRLVIADKAPGRPARTGGVVMEYRIHYLAWPRAGDRVELRSGLIGIVGRTLHIAHWMLDPATGAPWAVAEAISIVMDQEARKAVPITDAALEALRGEVRAELAA
jgi:acyl-CoA thioester hydrolase